MTRVVIKKTEIIEDGELKRTKFEISEVKRFLGSDSEFFLAYFSKEQLSALKEELNKRDDL